MMKIKSNCRTCKGGCSAKSLQQDGASSKGGDSDYTIALAGNPNTGKSTVFNALTGLKQHTGNWPGKTVTSAEGSFRYADKRYRLVDLPGTYSLLATSEDEEVARNYIVSDEPDLTVIVVDATRLERNLNLVLQILEITDRAVLCVNLMDEAKRNGITVDIQALGRRLGIPVIAAAVRSGRGLPELLEAIASVASGDVVCKPYRFKGGQAFSDVRKMSDQEHDALSEALYTESVRIAGEVVSMTNQSGRAPLDVKIDRIVTSRRWGFPIMFLMLAAVLWLTIIGSNYPSKVLSDLLVGKLHPWVQDLFNLLGSPSWLTGLLVDGVYLSTAWVVSVMLPPMAIFFPLFTLLEDFGYLPRVAFNLDELFRRSGAHGKQALTMTMGFGCNAAGVVSTRVIDSPRERLIAIITNNFSLCNGRWPTQILIASIFLGALVPTYLSGLVSISAVIAIALLGIGFMFFSSWLLSRTILRGEVSTFSLELPPYRPPQFWRTLYTSLIDRTLIVLWRAVAFAAPAGALIWLSCNVMIGDESIALWLINALDGFGWFLGLNGVIILAYILAIPANEIVIPTVLMLTVLTTGSADIGAGAGVLFENETMIPQLLEAGGWTVLTGVCLMLFSLLHNPCSTTIFTIYKETKSIKWTAVSVALPLFFGFVVCAGVAACWRFFA